MGESLGRGYWPARLLVDEARVGIVDGTGMG